ncbi:MAG: hypothetical protein JO166_06085 [Deltaproteobacteria bacterium]|nr:hypothetical protein [Deltaproteobacteria bacterium]
MHRFWLSFDLGLRGNYEQLYQWLDAAGSQECGDNVATFVMNKTAEQITTELSSILGTNARVYLIGPGKEGRLTGRFVLGRRKKTPPWSGYAVAETEDEEEA